MSFSPLDWPPPTYWLSSPHFSLQRKVFQPDRGDLKSGACAHAGDDDKRPRLLCSFEKVFHILVVLPGKNGSQKKVCGNLKSVASLVNRGHK